MVLPYVDCLVDHSLSSLALTKIIADELGAHYSYQIKLRDTGSYGFLLPRDNIVPTGEEMFDAMKYFGDYLLGNNGIERLSEQPAPVQDEERDRDDLAELRRRRRR